MTTSLRTTSLGTQRAGGERGPSPGSTRSPADPLAAARGEAAGRVDAHRSHADSRAGGDGEPDLSAALQGNDPDRFRGRGRLRGTVEVLGGLPAPQEWTLELRPSTTLFGREHAEARSLTFTGDQRDFAVEDLPLGGYDVRARAAGRNGRTLPVLLTRTNDDPYVVLEIAPAGAVEGSVLSADGGPAEGLSVWLASAENGARRETHTDALGSFRFAEVRDGAYRLLLGDPDAPLVEPKLLRSAAPGMRLPPVNLPPLATLDVFVLDEDGLYLPDARVVGSSRGGALDGRTDRDGRLHVPHLPPGRVRLRAEHPLDSLRSTPRQARELVGGETVRIDLRFRAQDE